MSTLLGSLGRRHVADVELQLWACYKLILSWPEAAQDVAVDPSAKLREACDAQPAPCDGNGQDRATADDAQRESGTEFSPED